MQEKSIICSMMGEIDTLNKVPPPSPCILPKHLMTLPDRHSVMAVKWIIYASQSVVFFLDTLQTMLSFTCNATNASVAMAALINIATV